MVTDVQQESFPPLVFFPIDDEHTWRYASQVLSKLAAFPRLTPRRQDGRLTTLFSCFPFSNIPTDVAL